jgi:hypothetical protein
LPQNARPRGERELHGTIGCGCYALREVLRMGRRRQNEHGGQSNEARSRGHLSMISSRSFVARGSFFRVSALIAWRRRL